MLHKEITQRAVKYVNTLEKVMVLEMAGKNMSKEKEKAKTEAAMLYAFAALRGMSAAAVKNITAELIQEKAKEVLARS